MVPVIVPVARSIVRPVGRPVAVKVSVSSSGSAKSDVSCRLTASPSESLRGGRGVTTTGASFAAATVTVTDAELKPPWLSDTV
jgi:hypothetical protein